MILLDTNILVALFRSSELDHARAKELVEPLEEFAISDYVLGEILTVLQLREGKAIAEQALDYLTLTKTVLLVRLSQEELEMSYDFFKKQNEGLSFTDVSLLILSRERKYSLATLDKDLIKAAKKHFSKH